jgi:olefin beta-lactone synthetase
MARSDNVASFLFRMARDQPRARAISVPRRALSGVRYQHHSYEELASEVARLSKGLLNAGIGPGVRTALMVPPSFELFALVFALFEVGAPLVMADPGMGLSSLATCLGRAAPRAFIGIPRAHLARRTLGWARDSVEHRVVVGAKVFGGPGALSLEDLRAGGTAGARNAHQPAASDLAAILFTSGSTGAPKGALYRHSTFSAQVDAIASMFDITPGEVDLPTFPLFALFDPALGMSTVIPLMDATRPASVDPRVIVDAVTQFGATNMFGSPALLDVVARWGVPRGVRLPTLRRVLSAGAPVAPRIVESFSKMLSDGARVHTPYGATECLPVSSASSLEILRETRYATARGEGICVGNPVPIAEVELIEVTDQPIASWDDARRVADGQVGEIVVRGPQVTHAYLDDPRATSLAKIEREGQVLHRMGDLARRDSEGRLWFYGRKSHRVMLDDGRTLFSVAWEGPIDAHPAIKRSALVGVRVHGRSVPVICVEPWRMGSARERQGWAAEILAIAQDHPHMQGLGHVLWKRRFPVDVRHNAKIRREDLAPWAARRLGGIPL